jgi:ABC-type branched-subunit amino acid transport system ATPase component
MSQPVLAVQDLTKRFGGLLAVDAVSFEVNAREVLGLIGPNGSGKSTVLNVLSGVHRATGGSAVFGDTTVTGLSSHLSATHLCGRHGLLAALAGPLHTRKEEAALRKRAVEAIEFVGLSHRADTLAGELTAGECRLLELARATVHAPSLVLLDEEHARDRCARQATRPPP